MHLFQDARADDRGGFQCTGKDQSLVVRDSSPLRIDELRNLLTSDVPSSFNGLAECYNVGLVVVLDVQRYKPSTFNDATLSPPRMSAQVPRISVIVGII